MIDSIVSMLSVLFDWNESKVAFLFSVLAQTTMSLLIIAGSVLVVGLSTIVVRVALKKNHFNPIGKHCYIGGGSEGLGLALAIQLVEKGAHVTILSRSQLKLDLAMKELEVSKTVCGEVETESFNSKSDSMISNYCNRIQSI